MHHNVLSLSLLVFLCNLILSAVGAPLAVPRVIASTWFPAWLGSSYTLQEVPWHGYNVVKYSFATTTSNPSVIGLTSQDETLLPQFVAAAHSHGVSAFVALGGWTGSGHFSSSVATSSSRTKFVNAILAFAAKYKLDGIDFDWETPNEPGIGCKSESDCDSHNFLLLLQQLRSTTAGKRLSITASVYPQPWAGPGGGSLTNVSAYAKVLDYIEIMLYNLWGPWSPAVGPNAPLRDSCTVHKHGSVVDSVATWTAAGFPVSQLVLAVPAYGYSYHVTNSNAIKDGKIAYYPPFDASKQPHGDAWDTANEGVFDFWGLVQGGFLTKAGTVAKGNYYRLDACTKVPYVYNPKTDVMVSYDDATSFAAKGNYVKNSGMKGFSVWHSGGDYNNILLNSIRGAVGL